MKNTTSGYKSHHKFLMSSPSKIRRIADHIRNKSYPEAMAILENLPHKGARLLKKAVQSAASNALSLNRNIDEESLFVKTLLIDDGPRMKRVWARGKGRRDLLLKRMSHILVVIDEKGKKGE
jgi:large subunit ribosomal protein L22